MHTFTVLTNYFSKFRRLPPSISDFKILTVANKALESIPFNATLTLHTSIRENCRFLKIPFAVAKVKYKIPGTFFSTKCQNFFPKLPLKNHFKPNSSNVTHFSLQPTFHNSANEAIVPSIPYPYINSRINSTFNFFHFIKTPNLSLIVQL